MSSQYKCIGEIRGILICNSFVVLILQPSCFCPRQSALGPSGAKMRRSRFCVAYFEEPAMSVFETDLKSKTWLWSQRQWLRRNEVGRKSRGLTPTMWPNRWLRTLFKRSNDRSARNNMHAHCAPTQSNKHRECCILFVCSADKCFAAKTLNVFAGRRD